MNLPSLDQLCFCTLSQFSMFLSLAFLIQNAIGLSLSNLSCWFLPTSLIHLYLYILEHQSCTCICTSHSVHNAPVSTHLRVSVMHCIYTSQNVSNTSVSAHLRASAAVAAQHQGHWSIGGCEVVLLAELLPSYLSTGIL